MPTPAHISWPETGDLHNHRPEARTTIAVGAHEGAGPPTRVA